MSLSDGTFVARRGSSAPAATALWKAVKRWLYVFHRWTGIGLCLLFATWFFSGLVMLYVSFPSFRAAERVATAAPIDWRQVHVRPNRALSGLGEVDAPAEMRLGMSGGEPVYRIVTAKRRRAVSARTGTEIRAVDARRAKAIAAALVGAPAVSVDPVDHDQWVVTRAYNAMSPFWRVRTADAAVSDIYISQRTGEVVLRLRGSGSGTGSARCRTGSISKRCVCSRNHGAKQCCGRPASGYWARWRAFGSGCSGSG